MMQFAQPMENEVLWRDYQFTPTMATEDAESSPATNDIQPVTLFDHYKQDDQNKVFFGEKVVSVRSLFKRYTNVWMYKVNPVSTDSTYSSQVIKLPYMPQNTKNLTGVGATQEVRRNSYLSYMSPSYICQRGSTRFKISLNATTTQFQSGWTSCERVNAFSSPGTVLNNYTTNIAAEDMSAIQDDFTFGANGATFQYEWINGIITAEMPFYASTRFYLACNFFNVGTTGDHALLQNPTMTSTPYLRVHFLKHNINNAIFTAWCAAGDDIMLAFYTAPPTVFFDT